MLFSVVGKKSLIIRSDTICLSCEGTSDIRENDRELSHGGQRVDHAFFVLFLHDRSPGRVPPCDLSGVAHRSLVERGHESNRFPSVASSFNAPSEVFLSSSVNRLFITIAHFCVSFLLFLTGAQMARGTTGPGVFPRFWGSSSERPRDMVRGMCFGRNVLIQLG